MPKGLAKTIPNIVRRHAARFLETADRGLERERDGTLHRARIAGKRLRYNLEFFASLLGDDCAAALKLLQFAQERLGRIADSRAFIGSYTRLLANLEPGDARIAGLETLRAGAQRERERALADFRELWEGRAERPYPDRLAAAISAALGSLSPNES